MRIKLLNGLERHKTIDLFVHHDKNFDRAHTKDSLYCSRSTSICRVGPTRLSTRLDNDWTYTPEFRIRVILSGSDMVFSLNSLERDRRLLVQFYSRFFCF